MNKSSYLFALMFVIVLSSCQNSDCENEITRLKEEIASLKGNGKENTDIDLSNKREEIIERYENGNKKLVVTYVGKGSQEQVIKKSTYYKTGKIKEEENYKQNELNGPYYEYYRNGQISVRANFVDGLKNGEYTEYYYDGTIWETGRFINGDYDGEYNTYFANGNLKSKEIYKNGDRIEAVWYNANGEVEFKN
ncbi:MAG: hypothetical protein VX280_06870 [Bacteroidota bacterium]|nr:hypothetical protein [Bacteroidota bacterium]